MRKAKLILNKLGYMSLLATLIVDKWAAAEEPEKRLYERRMDGPTDLQTDRKLACPRLKILCLDCRPRPRY